MANLQSQQFLKGVLQQYYQDLDSPLAWCTSAGPSEILRAMGFKVYFPENHGAMLGAARIAQHFIPRAHQEGFDNEVCSYLTSDIGAWLSGQTPLTQAYGLKSIPKPDLIVYNTNQCREVADWFGYFGREFKCPVVGIYPARYLEAVTVDDLKQSLSQLKRLISVAEDVLQSTLNPERLQRTVTLSYYGSQLWKQVLETAKQLPAPLTFFDGTILMAPIVVLRGTQVCIDFYRRTLAELQKRIEKKQGAIPRERVRIFWDGMPIWGRLRYLAETFAKNDTAAVASTYCNSWVFDDYDPANPLESLASVYLRIFINRGENTKLRMLKNMVRKYQVDGVVFHDSKTCFNNSNNRFGLPRRLHEETGVETLIIDGDLNDLRFFSDGQTTTRLETFFEQLQVKTPLG